MCIFNILFFVMMIMTMKIIMFSRQPTGFRSCFQQEMQMQEFPPTLKSVDVNEFLQTLNNK